MNTQKNAKRTTFTDSRGILVRESFFDDKSNLEMEIEFYDTGMVYTISKYKNNLKSKVLFFDKESAIVRHDIFLNGNFKISGYYSNGILSKFKTKNILKDFLYNRLILIDLFAEEAVCLKKSEMAKAPYLLIEHID